MKRAELAREGRGKRLRMKKAREKTEEEGERWGGNERRQREKRDLQLRIRGMLRELLFERHLIGLLV